MQSAADPPKKVAAGERAIQVDGADKILQMQDKGVAVEIVYASEGSPIVTGPAGIMKSAPNPNAARLFYSFLCGADGQQVFVEAYRHSPHPLVKAKPGRPPLTGIKLMRSDPVAVEAQSEEIKARYAKVFGV